MEIIIFIAVVVGAALLWSGYVKTKKAESDQTIDNWQPPKASPKTSWPFPGGEVGEGKIHVKVSDVAPGKSADDRVETPAPVVEDTQEVTTLRKAVEKSASAKKSATKPVEPKAPAKRAPAKKKST